MQLLIAAHNLLKALLKSKLKIKILNKFIDLLRIN